MKNLERSALACLLAIASLLCGSGVAKAQLSIEITIDENGNGPLSSLFPGNTFGLQSSFTPDPGPHNLSDPTITPGPLTYALNLLDLVGGGRYY